MRKPAFCIFKNKGADQLCGNCAADQHLCFPYIDSTIPLLLKSERIGSTLYEIYIGFCPRIDFHNIMHIDCLTYDYSICDIVYPLPSYMVKKRRFYVIGYLINGVPSV